MQLITVSTQLTCPVAVLFRLPLYFSSLSQSQAVPCKSNPEPYRTGKA
jgi:hypothetical protein